MKVAVTDACIFIDLIGLNLLHQLFDLHLEIHTSADVVAELYDDGAELYQFVDAGKLQIHSIQEADRIVISQAKYSKALSENDKTVLHLANQIKATVLSSDQVVRKHAEAHGLECRGMLWLLDQLVAHQIISAPIAKQKLQALLEANVMYRNNMRLSAEIQKRLQIWS
ncbi:PIN domain-containing protein [Dyadobacter aurulentus]|uniref:hypothetical protein n=1 Tax=Dyadobacter sp. UC 10 TaxID=2605428 RepID=UPI0011F3E29D|nr:hypothetical protein [Dyadobacter sp. UC 10]KAA0992885.1 hypothetical protein FXO21_23290 [Dyadobacter sp. UC 10]